METNIMPDLLDVLVCPACKGKLEYTNKNDGLLCSACSVVYPIEDDIPILLTEEAVALKDWKK